MDTSTAVAAIDTLGRRIGPRRHRTVEEKLQIVADTRVAGSSVADVARRYGVNANQVFAWRRQQEQGVLRPDLRSGVVKLLPVQVTGEPSVRRTDSPAAVAAASEGRIEITLAKDICGFRLKPAADSGACRASVPVHAGHPFRLMPAGG